jgi:DNA polymerase-4
VDLDAFYASVEQRDDPSLRGRPVLVGGPPPRGVVAAASYEARPFRVRSAMPMVEAIRRCPQAVVVRLDMARYAEASRRFFDVLDSFSPLVEGLSLDEAFVDVAGAERLLGDGVAIARAIKQRVRDELSLVASVGVAPTKFVAKIASDIDKPDGLRLVAPDELLAFLHPLPVSRLWGVGRVTEARLAELGLATIGQVAAYPEASLRKRLGDGLGAHLAALARGEDARDVEPDGLAISIGHEETFDVDLDHRDQIAPVLLAQADRVAARLRRAERRARVVAVKLKYATFRVASRRRTLPDPTCDGALLGRVALELLDRFEIDGDHGKAHRVRLCGVAAAGLEQRAAPLQLTLDAPDRRRGEQLGDVLDRIHERWGDAAIRRAIHAAAGSERPDGATPGMRRPRR